MDKQGLKAVVCALIDSLPANAGNVVLELDGVVVTMKPRPLAPKVPSPAARESARPPKKPKSGKPTNGASANGAVAS